MGAGPFQLELPANAGSLARVRHELARWLDASGVGRRQARDVVAACSEACANAAEHAYSAGTGRMRVEAVRERGRVVLSVRDFGAWREPSADPRPAELDRGRGFMLMNGLMDAVDVARNAGGTKVAMSRDLEGTPVP